MKILTSIPFLAVRPGHPDWQILCEPGPLAQLLQQLAGLNNPIPTEQVGERTLAVIALTPTLDAALVELVDTLITLRYETGRVQLELFSGEQR
jgi:hypothetical protein